MTELQSLEDKRYVSAVEGIQNNTLSEQRAEIKSSAIVRNDRANSSDVCTLCICRSVSDDNYLALSGVPTVPSAPSCRLPVLVGSTMADEATKLIKDEGSVQSAGQDRALVAVVSVFVAALAAFSFGYSVGYTSPTHADIQATFNLTEPQASTFGVRVLAFLYTSH